MLFRKDHQQEKKKAREARAAEKAQKQQKQEEAAQEEETEIVLGCLLRLGDLGEGTSWESIKQALAPYAEVAFVDYARGRTEAVVRFAEEGSAQAVLGQLGALEEPLTIDGARVTTSVLEGDEEAEYWKKLTAAKRERKGRTKGGQRGAQGQRGRGGEPVDVPSGGSLSEGLPMHVLKAAQLNSKYTRNTTRCCPFML
ncbi:unnamed protein product [Ixodes persulcatus]